MTLLTELFCFKCSNWIDCTELCEPVFLHICTAGLQLSLYKHYFTPCQLAQPIRLHYYEVQNTVVPDQQISGRHQGAPGTFKPITVVPDKWIPASVASLWCLVGWSRHLMPQCYKCHGSAYKTLFLTVVSGVSWVRPNDTVLLSCHRGAMFRWSTVTSWWAAGASSAKLSCLLVRPGAIAKVFNTVALGQQITGNLVSGCPTRQWVQCQQIQFKGCPLWHPVSG